MANAQRRLAGDGAAPAQDERFVRCWYDEVGWARDIPDAESFQGKGFSMESAMDRYLTTMAPTLVLLTEKWSTPKKYGIYAKRIHKVCGHRALFVTQSGYIGLAPWNAKLGDMVFVLRGGKSPFILRRELAINAFSLMGESYVYAIMGREALHMGLPVQEVRIQ
ncbi:hypothetical protein EK21DRAFT_109794 [Setomelanomma holmii]|uniref:Uncharacterized protein n=1 Tax=Setomelanomma holmii TaxID=210430 RepID=A0A9P4LRE7_9PLEO|nr:hypothetical protein EK21DRAFT_109794 [Setomelanomma holmii]